MPLHSPHSGPYRSTTALIASTVTRLRKKLGKLLALMAVAAMALAGCAQSATVDPEATGTATSIESAPVSFTDSTGRQVELPRKITRVASAGQLANMMLYAMAPDELVGWSSKPDNDTAKYIGPGYRDLPEYGNLYGDSGDFDKEAVLASNPQVIVDIGPWDEEYKGKLDSLQEDLGIPVILIDGALSTSGDAFRLLGQALGKTDLGEQLGAYADDLISDVQTKAATISEDQQLNVYYGEEKDGLSTIVAGSIHAETFDMVGARLVVGEDSIERKQKDGGTVSLTTVLDKNPDAIIFGPDSIGSTVAEDSSWASLDAVKNNRYYTVAGDPYNWIGRPPGLNRLLGVQWLGSVLYPETFDYDMVAKTKDFYTLFYRYDLTDDEAEALLNPASPSPSPSPSASSHG